MSLLTVLATIWLIALAYMVWIHLRAASERRVRRAGHTIRISVRAWPPTATPTGSWGDDARIIWRAVMGVFTDRPRVVPLIASIIAGGGALFIIGDLVMDEPALWPADIGARLPDWLRVVIISALVVGALANCLWAFFAARLTLSWNWLVLNPDGLIEVEGADMPPLDPSSATLVAMSIPSAHGTSAVGVTLQQNGLNVAFDYYGRPGHDQWLHVMPAVPHDWWHIVLTGEASRLDVYLQQHYGPGSAPFRRFTPARDGDS